MGKTYCKEWDVTENRDRETGQDRHRESGMSRRKPWRAEGWLGHPLSQIPSAC